MAALLRALPAPDRDRQPRGWRSRRCPRAFPPLPRSWLRNPHARPLQDGQRPIVAAMPEQPLPRDDGDDLLKRADALLARHRSAAKPAVTVPDIPVLTQSAAQSAPDDDIPTLTEVIPAERLPAVLAAPGPAAVSGEIVSRVQAQNLEHSVYQKLKRDLDQHIERVVQERFMPGIGNALDAALAKISLDIKSDINGMVRASIEETLRTQIKNLRVAVEAKAAMREATAAVSSIMPDFS